ncbi:hypothetical protein ACN08X_08200 [Rothia sp. P6271]|uniref:hypothetical protein n=1 Tax=Rothia sp. P6271 TaxID=3402659 RepID=UPI003ACAD50E
MRNSKVVILICLLMSLTFVEPSAIADERIITEGYGNTINTKITVSAAEDSRRKAHPQAPPNTYITATGIPIIANSSGGQSAISYAGPQIEYRLVRYCDGKKRCVPPRCGLFADDVAHRVQSSSGNGWSDTGKTWCPSRGSRPAGGAPDPSGADNTEAESDSDVIEFPVFSGEDFERLVLDAPEIVVEPGADTLVNYHTNFMVKAHPQDFDVEVLGFPVKVRAVPVGYVFDYGDGTSSGVLSSPGKVLGDGVWDEQTPTSHQYSSTGNVQVNVSVVYSGEYSVGDGGVWLPVSGVNVVQGSADVAIWSVRSDLVDR